MGDLAAAAFAGPFSQNLPVDGYVKGPFESTYGGAPQTPMANEQALWGSGTLFGTPTPSVTAPSPDEPPSLVVNMGTALRTIVARNDAQVNMDSQAMHMSVTAFHYSCTPSITIEDYIKRIWKYAGCSESCYVMALLLLERFAHRNPTIKITSNCIHRLLIASVMVATKFLEDIHYNNAMFAQIGGVSTQELNFLEIELLFALKFNLVVSPEEISTYSHTLMCMSVPKPLAPYPGAAYFPPAAGPSPSPYKTPWEVDDTRSNGSPRSVVSPH